jgi:arabinogalactan oligomer/maltooligosaccharide transport system permease protein
MKTKLSVKDTIFKVLGYLFILSIIAIVVFPVFYLLWLSMVGVSVSTVTSFDPSQLTAGEAYKELFSPSKPVVKTQYNGEYPIWFGRTILLALLTMIVQIVVVYMLSYAISRNRFKGKRQTFLSLQLIQMIPNIVALTFFQYIAVKLNMRNIYLLMVIYVAGAIPSQTILLKSYLDTVPRSLDQAAKIDGAGQFFIMRKIVWPLALPMIVTMAIWAFMAPFGDVILPKVVLPSQLSELTIAPGLIAFNSAKTPLPSMFAAGAVLVAIPIVILYFFAQKRITGGLTDGAVKG